MVHRNYHNGLKTTLLLGGMWALLLAVGAAIVAGTGNRLWIFVFAAIGLGPISRCRPSGSRPR